MKKIKVWGKQNTGQKVEGGQRRKAGERWCNQKKEPPGEALAPPTGTKRARMRAGKGGLPARRGRNKVNIVPRRRRNHNKKLLLSKKTPNFLVLHMYINEKQQDCFFDKLPILRKMVIRATAVGWRRFSGMVIKFILNSDTQNGGFFILFIFYLLPLILMETMLIIGCEKRSSGPRSDWRECPQWM